MNRATPKGGRNVATASDGSFLSVERNEVADSGELNQSNAARSSSALQLRLNNALSASVSRRLHESQAQLVEHLLENLALFR